MFSELYLKKAGCASQLIIFLGQKTYVPV